MNYSTAARTRKQRSSAAKRRAFKPTLKLKVGRRAINIAIDELNDAAVSAGISKEFTESSGPVTIDLTELLSWPAKPRWLIFQLMNITGQRLTAIVDGERYAAPFEAVVAAMVGPKDLAAHGVSVQAAIEAAAVFHPDTALAAADIIKKRLIALSATPESVNAIARRIRLLAGDDAGGGDQSSGDAQHHAQRYVTGLRDELDAKNESAPVILFYRGDFYVWSGTVWLRVTDAEMFTAVTCFLQKIGIKGITQRLVGDTVTNLKGIAYLKYIDKDLPVYLAQDPPIVSNEPYISFQNGLIDLHEACQGVAQLYGHTSRYVSTNILPFEYEPSALCPRWDQFLDQVLPIENDQDRRQLILQEFMGYCLLSDCRFEKALILYGLPASGKSTVIKICEGLLGASNVSHIPFDQLTESFRLSGLRGMSANFSTELDHLGRPKEALLKQLISGETINANRKFKSPVDFRPYAKIVVAANDLPVISDTSGSLWRRLEIIPFENAIPKDSINPDFANELRPELPGIFNWALEGLRRLLKQGRFTACNKCEQVLKAHRTASDSVSEFFDECCVRDPQRDAYTVRLYDLYRFFTEARGRKPVHDSEFGKRLKRLGIEKRKTKSSEDQSRPYVYCKVALSLLGVDWLARAAKENGHGSWHTVALPKPATSLDDAGVEQEPPSGMEGDAGGGPGCPTDVPAS